MEENRVPPIIHLPDLSDRIYTEMTDKGWFIVLVEPGDGSRLQIEFNDPVRLRQDIEYEFQLGEPFSVHPNLIVVPEVTVETIRSTIETLWKTGQLSQFKYER